MVEMKEKGKFSFKETVNKIGLPTLIIGVFWLILINHRRFFGNIHVQLS